VNLFEIAPGQQVYIVGKGRTARPGMAADNQNWALRLAGQDGLAAVSFLFRNADNRPSRRPCLPPAGHPPIGASSFRPTTTGQSFRRRPTSCP
jgi:hypothetical protein